MSTYCESEVVRLRCARRDEVLVVTQAKYGRMRAGRCMTSTYGVVGCSADVAHLLDARCSGRRRCDVSVASLVDERHQPCPLDFRSYLELAHKCVAGTCSGYQSRSIEQHTHTDTHPFNGPLSGTTRVSRYQKGKTNLDFTEARDSEWQWHQLVHMQVCTSL